MTESTAPSPGPLSRSAWAYRGPTPAGWVTRAAWWAAPSPSLTSGNAASCRLLINRELKARWTRTSALAGSLFKPCGCSFTSSLSGSSWAVPKASVNFTDLRVHGLTAWELLLKPSPAVPGQSSPTPVLVKVCFRANFPLDAGNVSELGGAGHHLLGTGGDGAIRRSRATGYLPLALVVLVIVRDLFRAFCPRSASTCDISTSLVITFLAFADRLLHSYVQRHWL